MLIGPWDSHQLCLVSCPLQLWTEWNCRNLCFVDVEFYGKRLQTFVFQHVILWHAYFCLSSVRGHVKFEWNAELKWVIVINLNKEGRTESFQVRLRPCLKIHLILLSSQLLLEGCPISSWLSLSLILISSLNCFLGSLYPCLFLPALSLASIGPFSSWHLSFDTFISLFSYRE